MRKLTKTLFGLGLYASIMVGVAAAQTPAPLSSEQKLAAETVITGQINAFQDRDHEKAFNYAVPGIRTTFGSTENFIRMVKSGFGAIYGARNWTYGRGQTDGSTLLQEVLLTGPNGKDWVALYTLRKQVDGNWRIAAVQIKEGDAQNT